MVNHGAMDQLVHNRLFNTDIQTHCLVKFIYFSNGSN